MTGPLKNYCNPGNFRKRQEPLVAVEPCRPPMTNEVAVVDGIKTAKLQKVLTSEGPFHMHVQKGKHLLGSESVGEITRLHRPHKKHSRRSEFTTELRRWILKLTTSHLQILHQEIVCRFYTKFSKSFDHHGKSQKEMVEKYAVPYSRPVPYSGPRPYKRSERPL